MIDFGQVINLQPYILNWLINGDNSEVAFRQLKSSKVSGDSFVKNTYEGNIRDFLGNYMIPTKETSDVYPDRKPYFTNINIGDVLSSLLEYKKRWNINQDSSTLKIDYIGIKGKTLIVKTTEALEAPEGPTVFYNYNGSTSYTNFTEMPFTNGGNAPSDILGEFTIELDISANSGYVVGASPTVISSYASGASALPLRILLRGEFDGQAFSYEAGITFNLTSGNSLAATADLTRDDVEDGFRLKLIIKHVGGNDVVLEVYINGEKSGEDTVNSATIDFTDLSFVLGAYNISNDSLNIINYSECDLGRFVVSNSQGLGIRSTDLSTAENEGSAGNGTSIDVVLT